MAPCSYSSEREWCIDLANQKIFGMNTRIFRTIFLVLILLEGCESTCTYPSDLDGVFYSSHLGSLTWNSSAFGPFSITTLTQTFSNLEFECYLSNGNYYVGRSESFVVFTASFYAYICLELRKISSNVYYYYYATTELSGANGARVKILPVTDSVTSSATICDEPTPYQDGSFSILYKNGSSISTEATTCPTDVQGYYTYTLNDGSTTYCSNASYLDVCTDTKQLTFDYTQCNATNVMYSASGELYCLYSQTSSSTHYVMLYNNDASVDDSTTFRTVCMVYEKGSGGVSYATQYPKECHNSTVMNATTFVSPGASLVLTENGSCPVTTTTPAPTTQAAAAGSQVNSGSIVGGALGALVLIAAIVVIVVGVWYCMKRKKQSKVGRADDKVEIISDGHEDDVIPQSHGETNSRTLFTTTNKVPNDKNTKSRTLFTPTGKSADVLSDGQITLDNVSLDDVEGQTQRDGQSLTNEYGEILADEIMLVSEKTMMSTDAMTEASLPMYSESGDTPSPTNDKLNLPGVVVEDAEETALPNDVNVNETAGVENTGNTSSLSDDNGNLPDIAVEEAGDTTLPNNVNDNVLVEGTGDGKLPSDVDVNQPGGVVENAADTAPHTDVDVRPPGVAEGAEATDVPSDANVKTLEVIAEHPEAVDVKPDDTK